VIGDIAILGPKGQGRGVTKKLAESLLDRLPNIKCVFQQEGGIEGEYRLRKLRHLAGEDRTLTVHKESGCSFKVDVGKCYFSPRLSTERLRIAKEVASSERVLNMFAGVGPFSIVIAKKRGAKVTSCELNSYACKLHEENVRLNRVGSLVEVMNLDASNLREKLDGSFDRVLMPHPSASDRFLSEAMSMAVRGGVVHYYRHVLGRNEAEASENLKAELEGLLPLGTTYKVRRVREVGPRWLEMAADIRVRD
jgi:tRNA (guanine37-N1)-methyltransferase